MIRFAPLAAALSLVALTPVAAMAQSSYYSATATAAPKKTSFVTKTTIWKCQGAECAAPKSTMQDKVMCERVAQQIGTLSTFTVAGTAFDAEALSACNARAK
ncbi:hypothetical protein [Sphingomonas sp.]|uniref:CC_3452 family protein n=1 Tax=Sphingomonas sp. TaxID=28214 RepID=UPI001EC2D5C7|nr:hypothetical protein [Sphingomonas sp.]MBX3593164.1 hypothetical protein [Sphingomonas sp.]